MGGTSKKCWDLLCSNVCSNPCQNGAACVALITWCCQWYTPSVYLMCDDMLSINLMSRHHIQFALQIQLVLLVLTSVTHASSYLDSCARNLSHLCWALRRDTQSVHLINSRADFLGDRIETILNWIKPSLLDLLRTIMAMSASAMIIWSMQH